MRLSFIVAGAQKCGTTALDYYLRQHPQVFLPRVKELHYFDNESVDWSAPDYRQYHEHFTEAPQHALLGEATPIYSYWYPSIERIKRYNSDIKLIILLRHPIERAYSHWRMEKLRYTESSSFSESIRQGRDRVNQHAEVAGCHRVYSYVERGFYSEHLERIYRHFPKTQVLLIQQHKLKTQIVDTLDVICDFLSIDRFSSYPKEKEVFSKRNLLKTSINEDDIVFLQALYSSELQTLKQRYGIQFPDLEECSKMEALRDSDAELLAL